MSSFHTDKRQLNLGWSAIQDMVSILQYMVEPLNPKRIVAVSRGGLVPARMLSARMGDIPIEVITASAYEGTRRTLQKPIEIVGLKPDHLKADTIIVDDIMDSGDTWSAILNKAIEHSSMDATLAVLVKKQEAKFINHKTFVMQVPQDVWVNFPWE